MLSKFLTLTDEELVILVQSKNNDAELELIDRYKPIAKMLGRKYFHQFKGTINCDPDDLISAALVAAFIASKTYDSENGDSFRAYWSKIAENEIMKVVKSCSETFQSDNNYRFINFDTNEEEISFVSEPEIDDDMVAQVIKLVNSKRIVAKKKSKEIFKLYIEGYEPNQIAQRYHIKASTVMYHIKLVSKKVREILLHS